MVTSSPAIEVLANIPQMVDLKENIENEVHSAKEEYLKMDSHIKLYITEMEQSL
jgi:kinetochore protein Nuf2